MSHVAATKCYEHAIAIKLGPDFYRRGEILTGDRPPLADWALFGWLKGDGLVKARFEPDLSSRPARADAQARRARQL
jgi:hypothetical protein